MDVREARTPIGTFFVRRLARAQPWYLLTHYQNRWTRSLFAFVNACISIGIMSAAALCTGQPLIFPSLGPTAFLCFYVPSAASSSPRNAILAHGAGLLTGWVSLYAVQATIGAGTAGTQIGAVALSLGLISALMIAADIPHPPAASTTLIVSLGLIQHWQECAALMSAVILLTRAGFHHQSSQRCFVSRMETISWTGHKRLRDISSGNDAGFDRQSIFAHREPDRCAKARGVAPCSASHHR